MNLTDVAVVVSGLALGYGILAIVSHWLDKENTDER